MKAYGLEIPEGTNGVINLTAPSGSSFPAMENAGELFFRTDEETLYVYTGTDWVSTTAGGASTGLGSPEPYLRLDTSNDPLTNTLTITGTGSPQLALIANGQVRGSDGSASKPTYSYTNESTTGWYHSETNTTALSVAGEDTFIVVKTAGSPLTGLGGDLHLLNDNDGDTRFRVETTTAAAEALVQLITGNGTWTVTNDSTDDSLHFQWNGAEAFLINSDRTLSVPAGSPQYSSLVTLDNIIPNKKYVDDAVAAGGGATALSDLTDVSLGSPITDNYVLTFDSALGTWGAEASSGGGGGGGGDGAGSPLPLYPGDNVSELVNDAGYLTAIPGSPQIIYAGNNISLLNNDAGYITSGGAGVGSPEPYLRLDTSNDPLTGTLTINNQGSPQLALVAYGQIRASDGSAGKPTYSFVDDTDTGLYRPSAAAVAVSIDGSNALTVIRLGGSPEYPDSGSPLGPPITDDIGIDFHLTNDGDGSTRLHLETDTVASDAILKLTTTNGSWTIVNDATVDGSPLVADNGLYFKWGSEQRFIIESDGTLSVPGGSPSYESLVIGDDDIPNKKYVDDVYRDGTAVNRDSQVATSGQTTFNFSYTLDYVDVFLNGVKLVDGTDFTATTGSTIVLDEGAPEGATLDFISITPVSTAAERQTRATHIATEGQTTFVGEYDAGFVDVFLNGVRLINFGSPIDYTATDGTNVVLATGASAGDSVVIIGYRSLITIGPGGSDTHIQFNNDGDFGGSANLTWDNTKLTVTGGGSPQIAIVANGDIVMNSQMRGSDGSVSKPTYSFISDTNTGMYSVGDNQLGFATNGAKVLEINSFGQIRAGNFGSSSSPLYSFDSDANTGMYRVNADELGLSAGGVTGLSLTNTEVKTFKTLRAIDGTSSVPAYTFASDPDTGMYRVNVNTLGFSTAGFKRLEIESNGTLNVSGTSTYEAFVTSDDDIPNKKYVDDAITTETGSFLPLTGGTINGTLTINGAGSPALALVANGDIEMNSQMRGSDGSVSKPTYSFIDDPDTGVFKSSSNAVRIAAGGFNSISFGSIGTYGNVPYLGPNGYAGGPSFSFISDTDTGMFLSTTDTLAWSTGGSETMFLNSNGELWVDGAGFFRSPSSYWSTVNGIYSVGSTSVPLGQLDSHGGFEVTLTSNGYRNSSAQWVSYNANSETGASQVACDPGGEIHFRADATKTTGSGLSLTTRMTIKSTEIAPFVPILAPAGSVSAPSYSFSGDTNTGMYRAGADTLGFSAGGLEILRLDADGTNTLSVRNSNSLGGSVGDIAELTQISGLSSNGDELHIQLRRVDVTGGSPLATNWTNAELRLLRQVDATDINWIAFRGGLNVAGSSIVFGNGSSTDLLSIEGDGQVLAVNGSASAPSYSFGSDTDTGMYLDSTDIIGFAANGVRTLRVSSSAVLPDYPINHIDGTAAAPSYTFLSDQNTGMYRAAEDKIGFTVGGEQLFSMFKWASAAPEDGLLPGSAFGTALKCEYVNGHCTFEIRSNDGHDGFHFLFDTTGDGDVDTLRMQIARDYTRIHDELFIQREGVSDQYLTLVSDSAGGYLKHTSADTNRKPLRFVSNYTTGGTPAGNVFFSFDLGEVGSESVVFNIYETAINAYAPFRQSDGSAADCSYSFIDDSNTGMYRSGTNELSFSTTGMRRLTIESNGTLNVSGTSNYETLVTSDDNIPNKKYVDDRAFSGTYTPTATAVTNVSTATPSPCQYLRVGDTVTVSGMVAITPTSTGDTSVRITPPIASGFSATYQAGGTFTGRDSGQQDIIGTVYADTGNDELFMRYIATDTNIRSCIFHCTYRVI